MSSEKACPECGVPIPGDAPRGLCPPCLLAAAGGVWVGLATDESAKGEQRARHFGDYELLEEIARGGMGVVYRARQISLNRFVAVKMILAGQLASDAEVRRFLTEAKAAASLNHPNIVEIHEVGVHDGQQYYSMKLIEGRSLASPDPDSTRSSLDHTAVLMAQVARAVHYAHQRGVLHRDLKPSNILVDAAGQPFVTDFGLAKYLAENSDLTLSGAIMGSANYMAPEQAGGQAGNLTTAVDVFSLGGVLYFLLTGRAPFAGKTPLETVRNLLEQAPLRPSALNPRVDRDLETICLTCLRKDPDRRYASAEALAEDLDRWHRGEPIHARPVSPPERLFKWARRRPAIAVLLALTTLAILSGITGMSWAWRRAVRAEALVLEELRDSYLAQARANRLSGQAGRRYDSLAILAKAAAIRPSGELRDEALACLACSDLRLIRTNSFPAKGVSACVPDDVFERYALDLPGGEISVRRLDDDLELFRLPSVGHKVVEVVEFSHTGHWLVARYDDAQARIWDLQRRVPGFATTNVDYYQASDFRSDDRRLALANGSGNIQIYDPETGQLAQSIPMDFLPERLAYSPDGRFLAVSGNTKSVTILEADTGRVVARLEHPDYLIALAWHPDNQRLATASHDRQVRLWDVAQGRLLYSLMDHSEEVHGLVFHPSGGLLLSSSFIGTLLHDAQAATRLMTSPLTCYRLKFAPDGRRFAGKTFERGQLVFGELVLNDPVRTLGIKEAEVRVKPSAFSPDGRWLAFADGNRLRFLNPRTGREMAEWPRPGVAGLGFDGGMNLWLQEVRVLSIWPLRHNPDAALWALGPPVIKHRFPNAEIKAVSPDGRFVAIFHEDHVHLYQIDPLRDLGPTPAGPEPVYVDISPGGQWLAAGRYRGDPVVVYRNNQDASVMRIAARLTEPAAESGDVRFSRDGRRLAINWGPLVRLYDTATWQPLWTLPGTEGLGIALAPQGQLLAVRTAKRLIRLVSLETGQIWATLETPNGMSVQSLVFSPDGATLAVGNESTRELFVWDLRQVRRELQKIGLDWPGPALAPESASTTDASARLVIHDPHEVSAAPRPSPVVGRIPPRDPRTPDSLIDLARYYNVALDVAEPSEEAANTLAALAPGVHRLAGVDFDIRGRIHLRGRSINWTWPQRIDGIPIARNCRRLHFLCATVCDSDEGDSVARLIMKFSDGKISEQALRYWQNIAGWWTAHDEKPFPESVVVAWMGQNPTTRKFGIALRLYRVTWKNPRPEAMIESVSFLSTETDAAPFLLAITAEP